MMANFTMTIHEMMNNPLTPIFPENYPFYCDDKQLKKEFEETFILRYLTNEIAFETPYLFNQKLLGKMKLIMPYYQQLYLTEWQRVGKDMMNQKDLIDKTTHTLTQSLTGGNQLTQSSQSTDKGKNSNLANGVSSASLEEGYLTEILQNDSNASGTSSQSTNSQTILEETTINESHGDVGIQTPAYAINEWRKIIININQMIIDECSDLFMKIY